MRWELHQFWLRTANLPGDDNTISTDLDETVAVAIAEGAPAALTVSFGGLLAQSFDLRALRRTGDFPAALYRDKTNAETIVTPSALQSISATTSAGPATGQFGLKVAALAYWQPLSTTIAPSASQAYLSLYFQDTNLTLADGTDLYPVALPGSAVQIVLPDGSTVASTYLATSDGSSLDLFDGIYYALVPAGITSAKIVVNPGPTDPAADPNHDTLTLDIPGPLTTSVTFPPPWTPVAVSPPLRIAPIAPRVGHGKSSTWVWVLLAVLVVLVAGSGSVLARRRRAWVPVRELEWPPRALPPATIALLSAGSRLALLRTAANSHRLLHPNLLS